MLVANRAGDQLVITKLDRLGWSLDHLIDCQGNSSDAESIWLFLIRVDTSTAVGRTFFRILGSIAEFENTLMSERTMDGLAVAWSRGCTGGQKPKPTPRQVKIAREMYEETGADGKRAFNTPSPRSSRPSAQG